jgi:hypothetical protein
MKVKHGQGVSQTEQGVIPVSKRVINTTPGAFSYTGIDSNFAIPARVTSGFACRRNERLHP